MNSHSPSILTFFSLSLMLAATAVGLPPATLWPNHCRHHQTYTSIDHDDDHWWGGALDGLRENVKQLGRLGMHGLSGLVRERIKRHGIKPTSGRGPRLSWYVSADIFVVSFLAGWRYCHPVDATAS